jgi:hypothetical protein
MRRLLFTTTLDLYSLAIDAAKLETQEDIALAIQAQQSQLISPTTAPALHCEVFRGTMFGVTAPFLTSHREEK